VGMVKVFISGNFNVVHPGHIRIFKKARELGSHLVIGVISSSISPEANLFPDNERLDAVSRNSLVDEVVLIDKPLLKVLEVVSPNIILKGTEYEGKYNDEVEYANRSNIRIVYSDGDPFFSESDLVLKSNSKFRKSTKFSELIPKIGLSKERINEILDRATRLKVTVIGDFVVDEYVNCEPLGLSQEDANVILKPIDSAVFLGGASIVARHARGLGAEVTFLTTLTESSKYSTELKNQLVKEDIGLEIVQEKSRDQIVKRRFRVDGTSRFRITEGSSGTLSQNSQNELSKIAEKLSKASNLVIFSDFNYGAIPMSLPGRLLRENTSQAFFAADSQISSQIGDLSKFSGIDFLSATEFEARVSMNARELGLAKLISQIRAFLKINNVILKLGKDGLIYESENRGKDPITGAIPALNSNPLDVAGAGDSLLAASSLALCTGATLHEASIFGSMVAAIQVGRIGNLPIAVEEIHDLA